MKSVRTGRPRSNERFWRFGIIIKAISIVSGSFVVLSMVSAFALPEQKPSDISVQRMPMLLVDDPQKFDRNKAILFVDQEGKPFIYLVFRRTYRCAPLSRHSKEEVLSHWANCRMNQGANRFCFKYCRDNAWRNIVIELRFKDSYCSEYRVICDEIRERDWLDSKKLPSPQEKPLQIGVVEGPRDMPDCAIDGPSEKNRRSIQNGFCPLGRQRN